MAERQPTGVLLVGSIPLETTEDVFTKVSHDLGDHLLAMPDGETGERDTFIWWQLARFSPELVQPCFGGKELASSDKPTITMNCVKPTGYDDAALASYSKFVSLRDRGKIPKGMRFQVSLPLPCGTVQWACKPEFRTEVEPIYEHRLGESISRIVQAIPHEDLVIQWDLACETLALEVDQGRFDHPGFKSFFEPVQSGIVDRIVRICKFVPLDVNIAFHFCYGDLGHKHFVEPEDCGLMVDFANEVLQTMGETHRVEWIHMPVPRERDDEAYFDPLKTLQLNDTRLFLGLVHAHDEEGTRKRIAMASAVCPHPYGVATECGMGRTPRDELDSILAISKSVANPVKQELE